MHNFILSFKGKEYLFNNIISGDFKHCAKKILTQSIAYDLLPEQTTLTENTKPEGCGEDFLGGYYFFNQDGTRADVLTEPEFNESASAYEILECLASVLGVLDDCAIKIIADTNTGQTIEKEYHDIINAINCLARNLGAMLKWPAQSQNNSFYRIDIEKKFNALIELLEGK